MTDDQERRRSKLIGRLILIGMGLLLLAYIAATAFGMRR